MNASHIPHPRPASPHPAGTRPVGQRTVLLVAYYLALAAQLAIWSSLAARVGLVAAFTQTHPGAEASVVVGGGIWLVMFAIAVAAATIRYSRHAR